MMKIKVCILIILMLISPILSISAITESPSIYQMNKQSFSEKLDFPPSKWLVGADQFQINYSGYCMYHIPEAECAQAFIPTKQTLTAVALHYSRTGNPHDETTITVSIRKELDGSDLTTLTILAKEYKIRDFPPYTWILFDFPDITVVPGQSYYIHVIISHGDFVSNTYGWTLGINNQYSKGDAWYKEIISDWMLLDEVGPEELSGRDFCFITYHQEPKAKALLHPFLNFLEQHPHLFYLITKIRYHISNIHQ